MVSVLLSHQGIRERVDNGFAKNIKKKFPDKSFREATRELNKVLEELLWGKK